MRKERKTRSSAEVRLFIQELKLRPDFCDPNRKVQPNDIGVTVTLLLSRQQLKQERKTTRFFVPWQLF